MISIRSIKEPPTTSRRYEGVHNQPMNVSTSGARSAIIYGSLTSPDFYTSAQSVGQLRLFPIDGAMTEVTVHSRAGNNVATSAAAGEGRRL